MIWQAILRVPWMGLLFQLETVLIGLLVWQLTKHHYHKAWLHYAPAKARDTIRLLRKGRTRDKRVIGRLKQDLAEARGRLAAAQQGLEKPAAALLTYGPPSAPGFLKAGPVLRLEMERRSRKQLEARG